MPRSNAAIKEPPEPADMASMTERRSEVRHMCADMLEVRWTDRTTGKARHATALLEDISASGACLQLETAVPVGAEMRWECPNHRFVGHVRYCTYREIGYFAGVEFEAGAKWSKQDYTPRHLLDLKRLLC
jgi:hypothetical protein